MFFSKEQQVFFFAIDFIFCDSWLSVTMLSVQNWEHAYLKEKNARVTKYNYYIIHGIIKICLILLYK